MIFKWMQKCYMEQLFENESTWKKNGETPEIKEQRSFIINLLAVT